MKEEKLVSVVTATYNMAEYVGLAVESVLKQTYRNVEITVVDDGSQDDTQKVMEIFKDDERVKFLPQKTNKGQTVAKNIGLKVSKGDFIAFVDADNIWKPDKLEKQIPLFDTSSRIGVVYSDVEYIDGEGKVLPYIKRNYHSGSITESLLLDNFINFNSAVVKRECINEVGMFDESLTMGIDWDLWLRISIGYEFYFFNHPTYSYRIWPNQMSHNKQKRLKNAEKIINKFSKENKDVLSKKTLNKAWSRIYTAYGNDYKGKKERAAALKNYIKSLTLDFYYPSTWKNIVKLMIGK